MAHSFSQEIDILMQSSQFYLKYWAAIIGALWVLNILSWLAGSPLNLLGIYPRKLPGLIGIPFSSIPHQNFSHLLLNSIPLFFLGMALLITRGTSETIWISLVITIVGGFGVWLFARKGLHIGASSLVSGYFGYILISAYTQPGIITVLLALVALYYFGGIFFGIFPGKKETSWEGHLFGFLSGVLCAYLPNLYAMLIK